MKSNIAKKCVFVNYGLKKIKENSSKWGDIPCSWIGRLDLLKNINFYQIYCLHLYNSNQYFKMICENLQTEY